MKVIFLDIDGVLNSHASMMASSALDAAKGIVTKHSTRRLCSTSLGLLCSLVNATGAKLVITSSWRVLVKMKDMVDKFEQHGWPDAPIIGYTKRLNGIRGDEIHDTLVNGGLPADVQYVILDDDSDMLANQMSRLVQTKYETGFGLKEYHECIKLLS